MIFYFKDLRALKDDLNVDIDIPYIEVKDNIFLNGLKDVKGELSFYYDLSDELMIAYELSGKMLCPDSITLENVELDFDLSEQDKVAYKETQEGFYLPDGLQLHELIIHIVLPEVPIKVEKKTKTSYDSGDGWTILSEEEYNKASKNKIDPRLAKLLEYKED